MTLIEDLLSQTMDGKKELIRQELIVSVTEQLWEAMQTANLSKADLARALNKSKPHVTQLLSGERNMTLSTLADLAAALGLRAQVRFTDPIPPQGKRTTSPIDSAWISSSTLTTGTAVSSLSVKVAA